MEICLAGVRSRIPRHASPKKLTMEKTNQMNTATYQALRAVGATEEQATVIATAIPDIEPLRGEMDRRFTELELQFVKGQRTQTVWLASLMLAILGAVIASNFF